MMANWLLTACHSRTERFPSDGLNMIPVVQMQLLLDTLQNFDALANGDTV